MNFPPKPARPTGCSPPARTSGPTGREVTLHRHVALRVPMTRSQSECDRRTRNLCRVALLTSSNNLYPIGLVAKSASEEVIDNTVSAVVTDPEAATRGQPPSPQSCPPIQTSQHRHGLAYESKCSTPEYFSIEHDAPDRTSRRSNRIYAGTGAARRPIHPIHASTRIPVCRTCVRGTGRSMPVA